MIRNDLEMRMKKYENVTKTRLYIRTPVAIRIDGRAFHTFTKGFTKPFDEILIYTMQHTMKYLCENIQNCVLGYTQSDEITLILIDYQTFNTQPWFDNKIQKIASVSASMATFIFNKIFNEKTKSLLDLLYLMKEKEQLSEEDMQYMEALKRALEKGATFDSRCFNIPKEEVANLLYWRQLDAIRNSIESCGQYYYSPKELLGVTCLEIKEKLKKDFAISWDDLPITQQRGSCCVRNKIKIQEDGIYTTAILRETNKSENEWIIDNNIPIFKNEGREYIESLI